MSEGMEGKVAIISGGGRGIGRAEALSLASRGVRIVVNDLGTTLSGERDEENPASVVVNEVKALGSEAVESLEDAADPDGAKRTIDIALEAFGRLDILVNNAGIRRPRMVFKMSPEEWEPLIRANLTGHFMLTRFASEVMRERRTGRIINTASESGLGHPGNSNYAASKEGVVGFTRSIALELQKYGITVNAIRPRASTRSSTPELREAVRRTLETTPNPPAPLVGANEILSNPEIYTPDRVAEFVTFLCSEDASDITGCDFVVGGNEISLLSSPMPTLTLFQEGSWDESYLRSVLPAAVARARPAEGTA